MTGAVTSFAVTFLSRFSHILVKGQSQGCQGAVTFLSGDILVEMEPRLTALRCQGDARSEQNTEGIRVPLL
jgi:hypothetical protein